MRGKQPPAATVPASEILSGQKKGGIPALLNPFVCLLPMIKPGVILLVSGMIILNECWRAEERTRCYEFPSIYFKGCLEYACNLKLSVMYWR